MLFYMYFLIFPGDEGCGTILKKMASQEDVFVR